MKVLLLANIRLLGKRGATVEVASGYALNCLFPQGLAALLTVQNQAKFNAWQKKNQEQTTSETVDFRRLLQKLVGLVLTIKMEKNSQGTLFASLKPARIYQALRGVGIDVGNRRYLKINQPIKTVGEYEAVVVFTSQLQGQFKIKVI